MRVEEGRRGKKRERRVEEGSSRGK